MENLKWTLPVFEIFRCYNYNSHWDGSSQELKMLYITLKLNLNYKCDEWELYIF